MIHFPCPCGHTFDEPEEKAGGSLQCPDCGRLVDVPTLSDLAALRADGTYEIAEAPTDEADRIEQLERAFGRHKLDREGNEIDLRSDLSAILAAGTEEIPLELKDELRPGRPRYDPETGELIRPLDVSRPPPVPPVPVLPIAASLSYARGRSSFHHQTHWLPVQLLMPGNVLVMFFVLVAEAVGHLLAESIIVLQAVTPLVVMLVLAHYGTVVQETGPEDRDELPRPLRDLSLRDDIWGPFTATFLALVLCLGPALLVHTPITLQLMGLRLTAIEHPMDTNTFVLAGMLFLAGAFLFPAVLLTFLTGGTILNLRPDRLLGVIRAGGSTYGVSVMLALPALLAYGWNVLGAGILTEGVAQAVANLPGAAHLLSIGPLLVVGIYLGHLFTWHLGILYRMHHPQFPWVWQAHRRRLQPHPK